MSRWEAEQEVIDRLGLLVEQRLLAYTGMDQ